MACLRKRCRPITIIDDSCCGLCVTSSASTYCTKLCNQVTYTVTVVNNSDVTVKDAVLHVPLDGVYCLDQSSVTVNGESVDVTCLDSIPLGDIESNAQTVVTYVVTVMDYKRYIKTRALVTFYTCCCCVRRDLGVYSNVNVVQVCRCCC